MKRSTYSEPQIAFILRQADEVISVEPELGFFPWTHLNWRIQ